MEESLGNIYILILTLTSRNFLGQGGKGGQKMREGGLHKDLYR